VEASPQGSGPLARFNGLRQMYGKKRALTL
jgi:hypothetical protein